MLLTDTRESDSFTWLPHPNLIDLPDRRTEAEQEHTEALPEHSQNSKPAQELVIRTNIKLKP